MKGLREKILLLLSAGLLFGFSYTAHRQWKIIKGVAKEWQKINKKYLMIEINNLYRSKVVDKREKADGTIEILLTEKGKKKVLSYKFQEMKITDKDWDGKWRLVIFDIPEKLKRGRDALREKLLDFGFHELQKSVFILPYRCSNEVEFIIEFFDLKKYVRFGLLESIDNELHLKSIFNLV